MGLGCSKSFLNKHKCAMNPIGRFLEIQPGKALLNELIAELNFQSNVVKFV